MALTAGTRLGPYEILAPLGAGGMGEVYRARDTTLDRDVAIKVLPGSFAADPDRLARFEREAKSLAALNHPNIAQVYGLEKTGVTPAIVMELVEGPTLADRIKAGSIPVDEALPIARQIAEALEAAHERGIIHRDLKPANIKVREDGTVKVLDFGLAKAFAPDAASAAAEELANSPTLTNRATQMGVVLGTAAYMAPEQARGKAVDKRADIWAFGVVLYEMLTGRRPFDGSDVSEVMARVIDRESDWDALPAKTPRSIHRLLRRCLVKPRKDRLADITDARLEIDDAIAFRPDTALGADTGAPGANVWSRRRAVALATVMLLGGLAVGGLAGWQLRPVAAPKVAHTLLDVGPAEELMSGSLSIVQRVGGARTALAWSPDGRTLAFLGRKDGVQQVYLRDLDSDAAIPLEGTEGAENPVFSPGGEWIAFSAGGEIRKVAVAGGPPAKICDVGTGSVNGITWGDTGIILYARSRRLYRYSPGTETPEPLTTPEPEGVGHLSPHLLPHDTAVLYTEHHKSWTSGDERVMVKTLPDGVPKELLPDAADARYLPTGQLLFFRQGTAFVAAFDATTLELGDETAVLTDVAQAVTADHASDLTLAAQLAVSPDGTLAYVASPLMGFPDKELVSVDRKGDVTRLEGPAGPYLAGWALSPDGRNLMIDVNSTTEIRPFAYDLVRGGLTPIVPSGKREISWCSWRPHASGVACEVREGGTRQLLLIDPGGASPPQPVPDSAGFLPSSWSRDGRHLAGSRSGDLWVFSPDAEPRLSPLLATPAAAESHPAWSPDGRWLAYRSTMSGQSQVWVRPYPGPGEGVLVSINGGTNPAWNPNGRELFFTAPNLGGGDENRVMMAVSMADPLHPGKATRLFSFASGSLDLVGTPSNCFAVGPNGQQFFTTRTIRTPPRTVTHINLIFNWFEELKAKVPSGR